MGSTHLAGLDKVNIFLEALPKVLSLMESFPPNTALVKVSVLLYAGNTVLLSHDVIIQQGKLKLTQCEITQGNLGFAESVTLHGHTAERIRALFAVLFIALQVAPLQKNNLISCKQGFPSLFPHLLIYACFFLKKNTLANEEICSLSLSCKKNSYHRQRRT